ncbi:hypothetical protein [Variovorax paradoxus]|uniref:hypothetical protein n=1 Tax=Variovorax paradoxus TaxID=34073 RepID=UPI0002F10BD8|nr:hypothetical protein [Variovorax paradoxus]
MAHASNAGTDTGCNCASSPLLSQFKPFEWVQTERIDPSQQSQAAFLNDARDVVQGAQTLVQLLDWDEDRRDATSPDSNTAPIFDTCQRASLLRLIAVSLGLLHARIEDQFESLTG